MIVKKLSSAARTLFLALLCLMFTAYALYRHGYWPMAIVFAFMALVYLLASYLQWRDLNKGE